MTLQDSILQCDRQRVRELLVDMTPEQLGAEEALHAAISVFDRRLIDMLIESGAPMDTRAEHGGGMPMHQLLTAHQPAEVILEVLDLLIAAGADVNAKIEDDEGESYGCLRVAAQQGARAGAVCVGLMERGADPTSVYDLSDANALHLAAHNGMLDLAQHLLKHPELGLDGDARDAAQQTVLHYAAKFRGKFAKNSPPEEMVQLLIDSGLFDLNAQDMDGNTPLHLAAARANTPVVEQLLAAGAELGMDNHESRDAQAEAERVVRSSSSSAERRSNAESVVKILKAAGEGDK